MHRAALVAVVAIVASACRTDPPSPSTIEVARYTAVPSRQLDILLQIDNSAGTLDLQSSFAAAFGELIDGLSIVDGGLPDLHVGVTTSDLGTSGSIEDPAPPIGSIGQGGCAERGDDGALSANGAPVDDAYLVDEDDGGLRRRNYTGTLVDTVTRMVERASGGCGFEQPLAATMRAFTNNANVGFSRPDANLLVVILADEDDCSVRSPAFFGPESAVLGPLDSFRCTRFGVACDQPIDEPGEKTRCHANGETPYIEGVSPFVDAMRAVRSDPARVAVAAIVGPPEVSVELRAAPGGGATEPALAHSCAWSTATGAKVADPAVRIAAAIDALGPNSTLESVCAPNLGPAVANIARTTRGLYGITCLDPALVGDVPACSVTVEGLAGETPLSLCPAAGDCFEIVDDPAACGDRPRLVVHLASPAADHYVRARCVVD